MRVEIGYTYELNDGSVHKCVGKANVLYLFKLSNGFWYEENGQFSGVGYDESINDLDVEALSVKRRSYTSDNPQTWDEMGESEKGALLLAQYESKVIECWIGEEKGWCPIGKGVFYPEGAYRIKPVREVVEMAGCLSKTVKGLWEFDTMTACHEMEADYRITFETVDGKPDCTTIKMGEL